jgi:hypothetical protein
MCVGVVTGRGEASPRLVSATQVASQSKASGLVLGLLYAVDSFGIDHSQQRTLLIGTSW